MNVECPKGLSGKKSLPPKDNLFGDWISEAAHWNAVVDIFPYPLASPYN